MSTPFYDLASLVLVPSGYKAQKVYAQKPLTTDGQLTFSRASTATRVNSAGLIETVSSNVPRLDYTNSTCPKLLLEPSRTNVIIESQNQSSASYAAVINEIASRVAVANPLTGQNNAYKITTTSGSDPYVGQQVFGLSNGQNTFSLWLWTDSGQSTEATLFFYNASVTEVNQQSVTLTTTPTRYVFTVNFTSVGAHAFVRLDLRQTGPATQYLYTYGWQAEVGGYATSFIPTTSSTVTRLADACSKTGISSLIGQTEGVLFVELAALSGANDSRQICINDGTTSNRVTMAFLDNGTQMQFVVQSGGSITMNTTRNVSGLTNGAKIAYAYKLNDFAVYVNGSLLATDTNGAVPVSMSALNFDAADGTDKFFGKVNQALLFKTRLTNAQLAELTTL